MNFGNKLNTNVNQITGIEVEEILKIRITK